MLYGALTLFSSYIRYLHVWEVLFFKEQTDSCGRLYDLLLYNIKNRLPLLVAVCLFYSSIFFSHLVDLMTCRWFEWIYFPFQTQNDRITH